MPITRRHIARAIVDLHEGKIKASSNPEGGTTISFYIPGARTGSIDTQLQEQLMARVIPWSLMDDLPQQVSGEQNQDEAAS